MSVFMRVLRMVTSATRAKMSIVRLPPAAQQVTQHLWQPWQPSEHLQGCVPALWAMADALCIPATSQRSLSRTESCNGEGQRVSGRAPSVKSAAPGAPGTPWVPAAPPAPIGDAPGAPWTPVPPGAPTPVGPVFPTVSGPAAPVAPGGAPAVGTHLGRTSSKRFSWTHWTLHQPVTLESWRSICSTHDTVGSHKCQYVQTTYGVHMGAVEAGARRADTGVTKQRVVRDAALAGTCMHVHAPQQVPHPPGRTHVARVRTWCHQSWCLAGRHRCC